MKNAYSNIMGTYVEASEVQHQDTVPFQVVCPCCADSVFKVARPTQDGGLSQFFSHRQAPAGSIAECERRVSVLTASEIGERNAQGRAQGLKVFLSVMRDAIDLDTDNKGGASPAEWHRRMKSYKGMDQLQVFLLRSQRHPQLEGWGERWSDAFVRVANTSGMTFASDFAVEFQRRAASDVMRHMLTREGQSNHAHLMRHALGRMMAGTYRLEGKDVEGRALAVTAINAVNTRTVQEAARNIEELAHQRTVLGKSVYTLIRDTISVEMMGTLVRMPYREMLTNHRAGKRLLESLDSADKVERPGLGLSYRQ